MQQTLEGDPSIIALRLGEGIERQEIEGVYRFRRLVDLQIEEIIRASNF